MYDLKIIGGLIFDGKGNKPFKADIAIQDGIIIEVGECKLDSKEKIIANNYIITPGFIDLHTHYDGQISWDEELKPSVNHGVTTAILGNCGVGFAPCRESDRSKLINLMEGVEDIPGTALHEGITWEWETFPEYMNAIDALPHTIDFAVMVPHDPLRVYVMGERAVSNEPATKIDISQMKQLTRDALEAGAIGFSIGRSDFHKSSKGEWTPGSEAGKSELIGIASAFRGLKHGVLQAVNDFDMLRPEDNFDKEFDLMKDFFMAAPNHKGSISLMERDFAPDDWRHIIKRTEEMNKNGSDIYFQVAPRAIGSFAGLDCTFHPLMAFPSYIAISDKTLSERVAILRKTDFRDKLLAETPQKLSGKNSSVPPMIDLIIENFEQIAEKQFKLNYEGYVDYEQQPKNSIASLARKNNLSVWEQVYNMLLENNGKALIYYPVYNYYEMNYSNVLKMMRHPKSLMGLSDSGAHVGTICDASFSTYLLSHWTRDRITNGLQGIDLSKAIMMLTSKIANYLNLDDRGVIEIGKRADLNVIDYKNLALGMPKMVADLPTGSQRLLQSVKGYKYTIVKGQKVIINDKLTNARPGRLIRAGR
ncbi:amidohydrolase family protein [Hellea sp.]|nr:amidohydrolase family protein [Hellea sp.]